MVGTALIAALLAFGSGGAAFGKTAPAPFNEFTTDEDQNGRSSGTASDQAVYFAGSNFDGDEGDDLFPCDFLDLDLGRDDLDDDCDDDFF